jgi:predicted enzyme related to lactoylglutathione lyase
MAKVVHFEIPAEDPEQMAQFFEKVFGWEIQRWEGPFDYWLITTGPDDEPGIHGAIMTREMGDTIRNTIQVESLDLATEKIEANGGKMLTERGDIPGVGSMAAFQDPEGNVFVIMEPVSMD